MKSTSIILVLFILFACAAEEIKPEGEQTHKKQVNHKPPLVEKFNALFSLGNDENYVWEDFKKVIEYQPNFKPDFYSQHVNDDYYFFKLGEGDSQKRIAIKRQGFTYGHEIYFMSSANNFEYIEEAYNIYGDCTFLNEYGYEIYTDSVVKNSFSFTTNIMDQKMFGCWETKRDSNNLKLKCSKDSLWIMDELFLYSKEGNELKDKSDSLLFNVIAFGENKLLIYRDQYIIELKECH